jgi:hypothetical protein
MNEVTVQSETLVKAGEARMRARETAAAYHSKVLGLKHQLGLSAEEAITEADKPTGLSAMFRIMDLPPEAVTWEDLQALIGNTGERSAARWETIKRAALEELRSGDRAGGVLQGHDPHPFRLARFLAIREELADGWQPRNGIERQLIDQMAQAEVMANAWLERLALDASLADPEAAEKAGAMVERFHKMFVRTLRALHDLRKLPLAVFVQNAGQVNVGHQQVNMTQQPEGRNGAARRSREGRRPRGSPVPCTCPADRRDLIGESR